MKAAIFLLLCVISISCMVTTHNVKLPDGSIITVRDEFDYKNGEQVSVKRMDSGIWIIDHSGRSENSDRRDTILHRDNSLWIYTVEHRVGIITNHKIKENGNRSNDSSRR